MNTPSEPVKGSEYILRRVSESFSQFTDDLWYSVPIFLLIPTVCIVLARIGYASHYRRKHGSARPDATLYWLGWASIVSVIALVAWTLVAFYKADTATTKAGVTTLSSLSESNERMWYIFTGCVLGLGALFVVLMYVKDARSVRWFWAVKLAILRIAVYALLCFVFLLPARQTWEKTEKSSRVVVLIDVSPSVTRVSDDVAGKAKKQRTRMDVILDLLQDKDIALIENLLKTNPVAVYPFGSRLDVYPRMIESKPWGLEEWTAFATYDFRPFMVEGLSAEDQAVLGNTIEPVNWSGPAPTPGVDRVEPTNWAEWAEKWTTHRNEWAKEKAKAEAGGEQFQKMLAKGLSLAGNAKLSDNIERLERRLEVARSIALGTNVPDSINAALTRETPNMVQGVIVFSDMRSNLGSDSSYLALRNLAASANIPVFAIAVGNVKQNTSINITEILADDAVSNQGSKISVDADGIGLSGKTVSVELDLFLPGMDPSKQEPAYTLKDSRKDKTKGSPEPYTITFTGTDTPHGRVEFVLDPAKLAAENDVRARSLVTESIGGAFTKPVLKDGKWIVRARIPRDENEVFAEPEHVRELPITVIAKKLRVLLIADAPSREFQFLRSFLNREVLENRATLTLLVQNEAGTTGNLTPNPTEKVIQRFPTRLDLSGKISDPVEKLYNLNEYDVIVAFDPNWKEVSKEQTEAIRTWVERQGGGFIFIPDRINTDALAVASFPSAPPDIRERLTPILDILPVIPEDSRTIAAALPPPRTPRRLYLHPTPESDLLRIDEPPPAAVDPTKKEAPMGPKRNEDPVAGWERFFTDRDKYIENKDDKIELFPKRGFFSCYPVKDVKPTAAVLAEFVYDDFNRQKAVRPWLVVSNPSAAQRTCFLASGEIYRMRAYDQRYPEQFWDKMLTFMAEKRNVKSSRGHLQVSREVISGRPIRVQAQILDASSRPYPPNAISPKFTVFQVTPDGTRTLISKAPIEMKEGVEGYYTGQVRADPNLYPPGDSDYFVVVDVPDSPGDTLQGKFKVLKSDLEMNDTTPDFAAHLRLASEFNSSLQVPEPVRVRFSDPVVGLPRENGVPKLAFKSTDRELIKLIAECFRTVRTSGDVRGPVDDLWDEQVALYDFKLAEDPRTIEPGSRVEFMHKRLGLEWHPESNPRPATSFRDFLHKGPKVFRKPDPGYTPTGDNGGNPEGVRGRWPAEQIAVNWAVLVVVFLLCWEWLTRKLLRLA